MIISTRLTGILNVCSEVYVYPGSRKNRKNYFYDSLVQSGPHYQWYTQTHTHIMVMYVLPDPCWRYYLYVVENDVYNVH